MFEPSFEIIIYLHYDNVSELLYYVDDLVFLESQLFKSIVPLLRDTVCKY